MTSNKVTMKRLGADRYCWAVLVDGRVKYSGLSEAEAYYRKLKAEETLNSGIRKLALLNLLGGVSAGILEAKCEGNDAIILEEVLQHVKEATALLRCIERMD